MSQPYRPNLITRVYYAYKSIRLPFRRKLFRGFDLDGNKFYESYNALTPNKWRRTVQYVHDGHYTDNNVTPQWMSWLRHTRRDPPTMDELRCEVSRIHETRANAALVARRWDEERVRLSSGTGGGVQRVLHDPEVSTAASPASLQQSDAQLVRQQDERESMMTDAQKQQRDVEQAAPVRTTQGDEKQQQQQQGDYMVAPGSRDEKGEWQPEAWNPASARKPIRR